MKRPTTTKGFTLFYALLVTSLALAIGASIYDITVREIDLSGAATQSQYAVYAADSGAECALYWDSKYITGTSGCTQRDVLNNCIAGSIFATSSASIQPAANSGFLCGSADITAAASSWTTSAGATGATTTFTLTGTIFKAQTPCETVQVVKAGNPAVTTITSQGFNTCTPGPLQLERVLQVSY